jgi:amino acid adenylation domain-containing protein
LLLRARQQLQGCALVCAGQRLSYAELADQVGRRAEALRGAGLAPGQRVALAAERCIETVIELLAAVDLGLCYVPLDPAYPDARLRAMLEDAQPRAVLGAAAAIAALEARLGTLPRLQSPAPHTTPHAGTEALTYVLFTSGSTGRPKGVAMGPLPLQHLIEWHAEHPRLGQPAVTAAFAPLSFDVHFQEIFSTLACGGCLVLLSEAERRDPALLLATLKREGVQRLFLPYVALQMLAEACLDTAPPPLLDVISAGEQLQVTAAIRRLFERLPGSVLHNHYGPTESHVVTAFELAGDPALWPPIPPIGRALPHVRIALGALDDGGADEGELLLGGDTLAAGYLGRAELSAERFVEGIDALPGRVYRTGDRVRLDADGVLHYLGRADAQLKIDGYRIEPGEIEIALLSHPALRDAAVGAAELPGLGRQLLAWVVPREAAASADAEVELVQRLREHLGSRLPDYMQPARYVFLSALPTTPSGKIDRRGLPLPTLEARADLQALPPRARLLALWREILGRPQLGEHESVFEAGARSLSVLRLVAQARALGLAGLSVAAIYDQPSVAGQAARLAQTHADPLQRRKYAPANPQEPIAIIGWALRAAGSADVETFWQNLLDGVEGIRFFRAEELDPSLPAGIVSRPNFVAARGVLDDADRFDAGLFGISKAEATLLDPQQRLLLELAWTALEDAAIDPQALARSGERVGVYAGTANNSYAPALRAAEPERVQASGEFALMLASEKDYAATRIAHRLDLRGPAVSVHTACSTGLVAVVEAVHALRSGRCELALAGGASVLVPQAAGYLHVEGGMESADGHCRPFDAEASGTVFASAGAVVVLKPLSRARADGDHVHALICGVGLNNDGADKASFTAPSVQGQADCVRMALDDAGVSAGAVGYVEAHGTGTALGDPIEVAALTRAFAADAPAAGRCVLGSLKSNLGHTIAAAGVLGLIKAALCVEHGRIPGTLHYRTPNPQIDFGGGPFRVGASTLDWPAQAGPRYAGVSSFGVGGTNAHVLLQAPPTAMTVVQSDEAPLRLFPLSAKSDEALQARAQQLAEALERRPELSLDSVLATLVRGRSALPHRRAFVARDRAGLLTALRAAGKPDTALPAPRLVFLFPGQGAQQPGMAAGLYAELPAFAAALDQALAATQPLLDIDLRALLLDAGDSRAAAVLAETRYAQPALLCMEFALAKWLQSLQLQPAALIGHSLGEYSAAVIAGVLSIEAAARAVCARAAAMWAQPRGGMLAVRAAAQDLDAQLSGGIEIAGYNAPQLTVLAGPAAAIDALEGQLGEAGISSSRLRVSHAFHSASMEAALPAVRAALAAESLHAPQLPIYSCISGAPLSAAEATDPDYWAGQVRAPVRFSAAVQRELAEPGTVLVEVGPGQALSALVRQHRDAQGRAPRVTPLMAPPNASSDAAAHAVDAVGRLWSLGLPLHWPLPRDARRAKLPSYPFADTRFWFTRSAPALPAASNPSTAEHSSPARAAAPAEGIAMADRRALIETELRRLLADVAGLAPEELDPSLGLVEQGLDSLSLTQATLELERVFGIKLRFRRLMEDLDTLEHLSAFFDAELPPERFAAAAVAPIQTAPSAAVATPSPIQPLAFAPIAPGNEVLAVIQQQMALMQQQLAVLSGSGFATAAMTSTSASASAPVAAPAATPSAERVARSSASTAAVATLASAADEPADLIAKPFGASARITVKPLQQMSAAQHDWLRDFTARYLARSGRSRAFSQQHRARMADPRVVTGFNPLWKDLVYPIVADRSDGARIWDIDGNAYIDLLSGFGANLLGYQPAPVVAALHAQLDRGLEVGPQHPLAASVADLISEFTGHARVGFCNTGSEAVMGAMRMARTVTGRKTIAIFTHSYHGIFDEVIVRGSRQLRSLSAAPGILASAVENVLVLDYASEDSLKVLRERGHELAAIMIEPIQNKYPTLQPRAFVHALREICDSCGAALIFDEVVTGFRLAPGGAQQFYGVRADICTYGKIIGGGLPFAAIGGSAHWMDALDGGYWQFGDDSYPEAGVTYFAGTFVRHPLALAAAQATLTELKRGGQAFYDDLNARTQGLIDRLNAAFVARSAPVRAVHCASLWRLQWDEDQKSISLFYYLARFHGLHLFEQFGHFVTAAMGAAELERIASVFIEALDELMALGFIRRRDGAPDDGGGGARSPIAQVSSAAEAASPEPAAMTATEPQRGALSPGQHERWLAASFDEGALRALDETFSLELRGALDRDALQAALQFVCSRHSAFTLALAEDAPQQYIEPSALPRLQVIDLDREAAPDDALRAAQEAAAAQRFALGRAPMIALSLFWLSPQRAVLHLIASHLVFDGWAASVFVSELAQAYQARLRGVEPQLPPAESPIAFAQAEADRMSGPDGTAALAHWTQALRDPPPALSLGDRSAPSRRSFTADTLQQRFDGALFAGLKSAAKRERCTLFQLLLATTAVTLRQLSGQCDFVLSLPYASQALGRHPALLADGVLDLPIRLKVASTDTALSLLPQVRQVLMDALEQPLITQGQLARALKLPPLGNRPPLTGVFFNLNPRIDLSGFAPLAAALREGRKPGLLGELIFNFYDEGDAIALDLHHSPEFFSPARIARIAATLEAALRAVAGLTAADAEPAASVFGALTPIAETACNSAPPSHVLSMIRPQIATCPQREALRFAGRSRSYAELGARVEAIAEALRAAGIGPGDRVGLYLKRSLDLPAAMLGVFATGAAYVPLDPAFPRGRLKHMAEDAALRVLLCDEPAAVPAELSDSRHCLALDAIPAAPNHSTVATAHTGEAAAYVLYTSGSTGKPKGVQVRQRNVASFLAAMQQTPGLGPDDRLLAVTTPSFDISVLELLLPLTVGACCVIASEDEAKNPALLWPLLRSERCTHLQTTPSVLQMWLSDGDLADLAGRTVLLGGEGLPAALASSLLQTVRALWNMYGPTETTVWSSCWRVEQPERGILIGADRRHVLLSARSRPACGAGRCRGRAVHRRPGCRRRLSEPARAQRRPLRARGRHRGRAVSQRRSGGAGGAGPDPSPGPARRADQTARLSDRARRDRIRAAGAGRSAAGRGGGARGSPRRSASGCLRGAACWRHAG